MLRLLSAALVVTPVLVREVSASQTAAQDLRSARPAPRTSTGARSRRLAAFSVASLLFCLFWPLATAYGLTYYVAPGGDDGNAGTESSPWASIQRAANVMVPGDTVLILPGLYVESVNITRSGTADAYITYQGMPGTVMESPNPSQSLEGLDIAPGVAYIRLQGFELRGGFHETIYVREGAHHIEIRDCHLHHNHAGIAWRGSSHGLVERVQIHDNKTGGMGFRYGAHDIVVRDTVSYNHNDGLPCSDGDADGFAADETAYNITFEGAEAFGNSEDGFDLKGRNILVDRSISRDNNCVGVKLWNTAVMQNSLVYGNGRGVVLKSIVSGGGTVVRLVNNTVVDNAGVAIAPGGTADQPYAVELFNNILSGNDKLVDFLDCVSLTENFNIFHRPDPSADHIVKRLGCVGTSTALRFSGTAINSGAWYAHSGQGAQSQAANPLYVDAAARDYSLQAASPAIDAGSAAVAPSLDLAGVPRPQGKGVDLGAYEATGLVVLSVVKVGTGTGVVTSAPAGISCGADCSGLFDADSTVTLTAIAGTDSKFMGWSGGGCGTASPCTAVISADVQITATFTTTVTPADLVVTLAGNPPASGAPGATFSVNDTAANQGGTATLGSSTRYYLSLAKERGPSDILLAGSRIVPILAPNATSSGSVSVTVPSTTPPATYYLLACADDLGQVPESNEANNCRASLTTMQVTAGPPATGADLVVTEIQNPPASAPPGSSFGARDWILNQGTVSAGASVTRYYLSLNTSRDADDILLGGSRAVGSVPKSQTNKGSLTVTVPTSVPGGLYYLLACADDLNQVGEANEANNCRASQTRVQVGTPGVILTVVIAGSGTGSVTGPGIACSPDCTESYPPGTTIVLTASAGSNSAFTGWTGGNCGSANPCVTVMITDVQITAAFAPSSGPASLSVTLLANPPASAAAGDTFMVSDTVVNEGGGLAVGMTLRYNLAPDAASGASDLLLIGSRTIPNLAPNATSSSSMALTIPATVPLGNYYLLACPGALTDILPGNGTKSCRASLTTVQVTAPPPPTGADLVVTEMLNPPASAAPGSNFGARDWVLNQGTEAAGPSLTRYYLSLNTTLDAGDVVLVGSRALAKLPPGQTSKGTITVTIPASMPPGLYYLLACADNTNQVGEVSEANNCRASQTRVQIGSD